MIPIIRKLLFFSIVIAFTVPDTLKTLCLKALAKPTKVPAKKKEVPAKKKEVPIQPNPTDLELMTSDSPEDIINLDPLDIHSTYGNYISIDSLIKMSTAITTNANGHKICRIDINFGAEQCRVWYNINYRKIIKYTCYDDNFKEEYLNQSDFAIVFRYEEEIIHIPLPYCWKFKKIRFVKNNEELNNLPENYEKIYEYSTKNKVFRFAVKSKKKHEQLPNLNVIYYGGDSNVFKKNKYYLHFEKKNDIIKNENREITLNLYPLENKIKKSTESQSMSNEKPPIKQDEPNLILSNLHPSDIHSMYGSYIPISDVMKINYLDTSITKNGLILHIEVYIGDKFLSVLYNITYGKITSYSWEGDCNISELIQESEYGIALKMFGKLVYIPLPSFFKFHTIKFIKNNAMDNNVPQHYEKIYEYSIKNEIFKIPVKSRKKHIQIPDRNVIDHLQNYDYLHPEERNFGIDRNWDSADIFQYKIYLHFQKKPNFINNENSAIIMNLHPLKNKMITYIEKPEESKEPKPITKKRKTLIPLKGLYKVAKTTNANDSNLITITYFCNDSTTPNLVIEYNKKEKIILNYKIFNNNNLLWEETYEQNPNLCLNNYPRTFALEGNKTFHSRILPKIVEKLMGPNKAIKVIIDKPRFYNKPDKFVKIKKLIDRNVDKNNKPDYVVIAAPIKALNGVDYHMYNIFFILERFSHTFVLKEIVSTTSMINGYPITMGYWFNFVKKMVDLNPEVAQMLSAEYRTNKTEVITKPIYFNDNIFSLCSLFATKQLGSECCYTDCYKDMAKIIQEIPSIIHNDGPLPKCKLELSDMGISGKIEIQHDELDVVKKNLRNKLEKCLLRMKIRQNLHKLGDKIIISIQINTDNDYGPFEKEELITNEEVRKKTRSAYMIRLYFHKDTTNIYVIYRGKEIPVHAKELATLVEKIIKESGAKYSLPPFIQYVTAEQWKNPDLYYKSLEYKPSLLYLAMCDCSFLTSTNYLEPNFLYPLPEKYNYNYSFTVDDDIYFNTMFFLANKKKQIMVDEAEGCFFHILFHITQINNALIDKDPKVAQEKVEVIYKTLV